MHALVGSAKSVLLDFDGPVCTLFHSSRPGGIAERLRTTYDASGTLPLDEDPQVVLAAAFDNPALVSDGTARRIEQALTQEEVTAAEGAYPTGYADGLIRTLHATGRGLAVTTNNSRESVERYLRARGLLKLFEGHVHGRFYDGAGLRIKPDPDCLLRALESTGVAAQDAVMIGDAARDLVAARAAGVEFVGYARNERKERELREAGAAHIVPSLREVLLAVDPCAHV
ncbi:MULTISPECIES: HAD family phosphatase [unclassified Streptomyces]|uniref:HAD family hydrolase n=1 Tax=unclassified Streptomyces TaxID=2593676 RepID=UPI002DDB06BB|nr:MULTISPECIES: HAD family phosphatase [unclassified Streptomyces]WSA93873.1 HAD family phosphatase [Streptomyces sp. NBC_01795]WSB78244.1 HAD family phosphatase [Streptomyces sp. NBC_01775]WSS13501.1 HAD family phosphatase [Streptomyces sp. NBC_01186]WSS42299.1 HAD family phosphatase [Streptomyces sp. NBC_01187]